MTTNPLITEARSTLPERLMAFAATLANEEEELLNEAAKEIAELQSATAAALERISSLQKTSHRSAMQRAERIAALELQLYGAERTLRTIRNICVNKNWTYLAEHGTREIDSYFEQKEQKQ